MLGPFSWCSTFFTSDCSVVTHAQRQSNRGNEMCDNEMSFSVMPQLSIMKSRFAKASLRTRYARHRSWGATCRLPNRRAGTLSYPMLAWDTHLPNGCFGRQASQLTLRLVHRQSQQALRHSDLASHISVLVAIYTICWAQSMDRRYRWRVHPNM